MRSVCLHASGLASRLPPPLWPLTSLQVLARAHVFFSPSFSFCCAPVSCTGALGVPKYKIRLEVCVPLPLDLCFPAPHPLGRYKFGPFVPLPEATSSLLDAALILGKHGLHRVCVVDAGE